MKKAYVFPQPLNCLFAQFTAEQKRTVSCLHLRWLTCRVEYYIYLRQWAMGVRNESEVMGVVFLAIGDNLYWLPPVIEYLQNAYFNGRLGVLVK